MKITKQQLKKLISEELAKSSSILLEMPGQMPGSEPEVPLEPIGEDLKSHLYHMSQQSQQLHDVLMGDENLDPWIKKSVKKAAQSLEKVFKSIMYEKGPGQSHL